MLKPYPPGTHPNPFNPNHQNPNNPPAPHLVGACPPTTVFPNCKAAEPMPGHEHQAPFYPSQTPPSHVSLYLHSQNSSCEEHRFSFFKQALGFIIQKCQTSFIILLVAQLPSHPVILPKPPVQIPAIFSKSVRFGVALRRFYGRFAGLFVR
jgi:hypothetical protein